MLSAGLWVAFMEAKRGGTPCASATRSTVADYLPLSLAGAFALAAALAGAVALSGFTSEHTTSVRSESA